MTAVAKSATAATHRKELEDALDAFAINTWPGGLDTLMFPKVWRWKLAAKSGSIETKEDMAKVLCPACEISTSVLREWATSFLNLVHTTVWGSQTTPVHAKPSPSCTVGPLQEWSDPSRAVGILQKRSGNIVTSQQARKRRLSSGQELIIGEN